MSCCLYNTPHYVHIAKYIKDECGIELTASDNLTGNVKHNADWMMESHNIDVKDMYFTENIINYRHTLNKSNSFSASTSAITTYATPIIETNNVVEEPVRHPNWRYDTDKSSYHLYVDICDLYDTCFDFQHTLNNSKQNIDTITNTILPIYSAISQIKKLLSTFKSIKDVTKLVTSKLGGNTPLSKCLKKLAYKFADKYINKLQKFIDSRKLKIDKVNELMSEYLKDTLNGAVNNKVNEIKDPVIDKCLNMYKEIKVPYIRSPTEDLLNGFPHVHDIMSQALDIRTKLDECQNKRYSYNISFNPNNDNIFKNDKFEDDCKKYHEIYKTQHIEYHVFSSTIDILTTTKNCYPHSDRFILNQMKHILEVIKEIDGVIEDVTEPFKKIEPVAKEINLSFLDDLGSILSFIDDCQSIIPDWLAFKLKALDAIMDAIGIDTILEELFDCITSQIPLPTIDIGYAKFVQLFDLIDENMIQKFIDDMKDKCNRLNPYIMNRSYYGGSCLSQSCIDLPYRMVDRTNIDYGIMSIWLGENRDVFIFDIKNDRYITQPAAAIVGPGAGASGGSGGVTYGNGPR